MAGDENSNLIIRTYTVANAPTGECTRHVTADGQHWKPIVGGSYNSGTGVQVGTLRNGRIENRRSH